MEFFNFRLEEKLDHHSCVEFHSDSDGDGFNFPKCPLGAPPKIKFFNFGLEVEQKQDQHSSAEFRDDSDGDGFKAQKRICHLLIVPN